MKSKEEKKEDPAPILNASSIWLTYDALLKVNRPEGEAGWQYFSSSTGFCLEDRVQASASAMPGL